MSKNPLLEKINSGFFCILQKNLILLRVRFLSGATSNRKSVCITLFFNKLYLFYDVNPLNKVFTALHRLTQVCILGTIPKGKYNKLFCYSIYDLGNSFSLTSFM